MSWVSSGVVCVRGAGARAAGGAELLRRLEEAAEVARVQAAVRAALRAAPAAHPPAHLLQRLDDELLEITQVNTAFFLSFIRMWQNRQNIHFVFKFPTKISRVEYNFPERGLKT